MHHVVIVGGGLSGMLTALELRLAGLDVSLFERGATGRESSWAGGGIVSPLFPWRYLDSVTALASYSQSAYPTFCSELYRHTGVDSEHTQCGLILIAPDEQAEALTWSQRHKRELQLIDRERFAELEPRAANPASEALWMPEVGQVRNPRIVRALDTRLRQLGVTLNTDTAVTELITEHGRCRGVRSTHGLHEGDAVVVCSGAWSGELLGPLPSPPEIHPVRGQMLLFKANPGTISRMVLEGSRYVIPRRDGRTLFGSTIEHVGFDKRATDDARAELYDVATQRFPVLKDCPVEKHWAGLRPSSPAGVPYIGPHPQIEQLFVNAGHYRNGIVLGPASARLVADLVLGREPILDPSPYSWTAARG